MMTYNDGNQEFLDQFYVVDHDKNQIPLSNLKYWNVELQKPYINPETTVHEDFYPQLVDNSIETRTCSS